MTTKKTDGKSVFITGANGGLGLETSKLLAQQNLGRLVMAARTLEKATGARNQVVAHLKPKASIEVAGGFDMNKPEAIKQAVLALPANDPFDIIFFQVGGVILTEEYQYIHYNGKRFEKTVFQNVIGSYITLMHLKTQGLIAPNARIVFAGGEGIRGIPGMIESPVIESYDRFEQYIFGEGEQKKYNPMNAIGVSKLASALLTQKLAQLNDGNEYLWFSPGLTHGTAGLSKMAPVKRFFMEKIMFGIAGILGFSQSPTKGAKKYLDSLLGEIGRNGDVLGAPDGKTLGRITDQKPMNPSITDPELIEGFWTLLVENFTYTPSELESV